VLFLVLGLAVALIFGSSYLPAYAQEGVGDQLRSNLEPLFSAGEGEGRVLTSNWETLAPDEQHVYRFDYTGGEQPIRVWMDALPADAVQFQVWTDELVTQMNDDPEIGPLGVGEPIADGSQSSIWNGNAPEPTIYYVTVRTNADSTVQYLLNIASAGLAGEQPGLAQPTPLPPTATPVPTLGPTPAIAPTQTPLPGVTVVPAATPDPNLAVVTAAALNVRSGPSTAYPVITTVPAGTILTVLGRNDVNTWIAVRLEDGTEGWVTRSLTNYISVAVIVLTPEPPPVPTPLPGVTPTPTPDTEIVLVAAPSPEAMDGDWRVISEGETHWYTFQYRGGGLPVHVWMDVEPDKGAVFNILDRQTALTILAGVAPNVVNAIGRGTANPVEPGYMFWRADFPEADIYYVMVQHEGPGDVVYAIHVAGPGLSRPVPQ
jgi:hypothetical protein